MAINSMKLGLCASAWLKRTYSRHYAVLVKEFVPSGFKSHVLMMRVTGVWPTADDPSWYKWLTIAFFSFVGLLFPLSLLVNVLFANSIEEAMDYSFTSLSCWSSSFKTSMIFWQRQRVRELFRIHGRLSHGFGHNAEHHTRVAQINTRVHVYLSIVYSVTVCTNVVQSIFSKPEDAILPSTTHFPFEFAQRRAVFWSLFVCQTLCVNCLIIWTGIDDSFFIALINTTCGHLTDLKERLKSLGSDYTNADENRDLRFCKEMFGCCKQYEECSRFVDVMNSLASPAFFAQFGVSALVFCSSIYLLSVNNSMDDIVKFVTVMIYLIAIVIQLLVNCYCGSRLLRESDGITHAIYASQWIDRNEKCKRVLRIMTERSSRLETIRAGGLFELSLPTFVKVCRAAYSYFNVLHKMDAN